jgi:hypothetical protein
LGVRLVVWGVGRVLDARRVSLELQYLGGGV